jgi:uncharacterized membrane protein YdfJ with MMPL/SSD domain
MGVLLVIKAVRPRRLGRVAAVACALAVALTASCASPTLPLPPPSIPSITASAQAGKVHLSSKNGAQANAIIVIVNRDQNLPPDQRVTGTEADDFGSWDAEVIATKGDVLDITEESGTTRSPSTTVQVQ